MATKENLDFLKLTLATDEQIKKMSWGAVTTDKTFNHKTHKPEFGGIFCERIFGPVKNFECHCGKYQGKDPKHRFLFCEKCHVQITRADARRERFGHIDLVKPVVHIWFFRSTTSPICLLLDMSYASLNNVVNYKTYCVTEVLTDKINEDKAFLEERYKQILELSKDNLAKQEAATRIHKRVLGLKVGELFKADDDLFRMIYQYGDYFTALTGGEYVQHALSTLDLETLQSQIKEQISNAKSADTIKKLSKRLSCVNSFVNSGNRPEDMVMRILPVLPPEMCGITQFNGTQVNLSELSELYKKVVAANLKLKTSIRKQQDEKTFSPIIINEDACKLQQAVDSLIDNGRHGKAATRNNGSEVLKSLSDHFGGTKNNGRISYKAKASLFRANLLGKRVDYSGRSVIVVGPELKMHQCGLPKTMALELFAPFVIKLLVETNEVDTVHDGRALLERPNNAVWDCLEQVIREHPVLLNRAPTLHRLGIQAFEPQLVEGNAIKLHPLVCAAFNADFDGDQMAVHVPLSVEAQTEARVLMLGSNNILKPSDGKTITEPAQDMIIGLFHLTRIISEELRGNKPVDVKTLRSFTNKDEALMVKDLGQIAINDEIRVRLDLGGKKPEFVTTSLGRIIFNEVLPVGYPFVNEMVDKKKLGSIIDDLVARKYPISEINKTLDAMKDYGFHWATYSGVSMSFDDIIDSPNKPAMMKEAEKASEKIQDQYDSGRLTEEERRQELIEIWSTVTDNVAADMRENFDKNPKNALNLIVKSGARGNWMQVRQISGMRGLVTNPRGEIIPRPIKSNYSDGLNVQEYFISSHGARKGVADTAFNTAKSGYLTRRMVENGYRTVITELDCKTEKGFEYIFENEDGTPNAAEARKMIWGRYTAADVKAGSKVIAKKGQEITSELIDEIVAAGVTKVTSRSILTCETEGLNVCSMCYGNSMATARLVDVGEAVGLIAAQSIGEPGTQLTMRTFHTGGVATSGADLTTQGMPRLIQIIDAVTIDPKRKGLITDRDGKVSISETDGVVLTVTPAGKDAKAKVFKPSKAQKLLVKNGDEVKAGDILTEGDLNFQDILDIKGPRETQKYVRDQIQGVFSSQGIDIHDKHLEVMIISMLNFVEIIEPGDIAWTKFRPIPQDEFVARNREAVAAGLKPSAGRQIIIGARDIGLHVNSWLSAASYSRPVHAITNAAIEGKSDGFKGLKECVIAGKLIPAGTGLDTYVNAKALPKMEFMPTYSDITDFDFTDSPV